MSYASRIYRRLAQAFPHEFKLAYGTEVEQVGEDVIEETARRQGILGLLRVLLDIAIRVPLEYASEIRGDMRYASRTLMKSPGFALVGIISMALGIGLTTNVYTSRWEKLFRNIPAAANADRLVMMEETATGDTDLAPESYYYIEQYREQKGVFSGVAAFQTGIPFNVTYQGNWNAKPDRVFGQIVSPDYFSVLGVQPQIGRVFSPELDKPGDAPVVVISDRFWRNRLNSSPNSLGQSLRLNDQIATIVGITPLNFNGVLGVMPSELFVPITAPAALAPELGNDVLHQRNAREFLALFCLAPGVTMESAEAGLDVINRRLDDQDSSSLRRTDKGRSVSLLEAGTNVPLPSRVKPALIGFLVALMGLVIALACMNLANMLIARGANRRKEFAIRLSVGASRFRLVRQLISEGILLSLLGSVAGFGVAYCLLALASQLTPPTGGPTERNITLDSHIALFSFALAIVCGVGLSLLPALRATKANLTPALREGSSLQLAGHRRLGLRNLLMTMQVAGSLMLLLVTGFLVLGVNKVSTVQTKFDPQSMYLLAIDPLRDGYTPEKTQVFFERLPERLNAVAGVHGLSFTAQPPFAVGGKTTQITAEDSRVQKPVVNHTVGAGYFAALSEPMLAGREFSTVDQRSKTDVSNSLPVILNESAAHSFFADGNALGKHLKDDKRSYDVVGVVRDLNNGPA